MKRFMDDDRDQDSDRLKAKYREEDAGKERAWAVWKNMQAMGLRNEEDALVTISLVKDLQERVEKAETDATRHFEKAALEEKRRMQAEANATDLGRRLADLQGQNSRLVRDITRACELLRMRFPRLWSALNLLEGALTSTGQESSCPAAAPQGAGLAPTGLIPT